MISSRKARQTPQCILLVTFIAAFAVKGCKQNIGDHRLSELSFTPDPSFLLTSEHPRIHKDYGAGIWNSISATVGARSEKLAISSLAVPSSRMVLGKDAADHMRHYLGNSGDDYYIDMSSLFGECRNALNLYRTLLHRAILFSESLQPGTYRFMSKELSGGYCTTEDSENWFYASGGFSLWSSGYLSKICLNNVKDCTYKLNFSTYFFDSYNWDGKKVVIIRGRMITDQALGLWHRMGLAREFNMFGHHQHTFQWDSNDGMERNAVYQQLPLLRINGDTVTKKRMPYDGPMLSHDMSHESTLSRIQFPENGQIQAPSTRPKFVVSKGPDTGTYEIYQDAEANHPSVFGTPTDREKTR